MGIKHAAGTAAEDAGIVAAGGGPEDPVTDAAAVANTARRAASNAGQSTAAAGRAAYQRVSSPSEAAQTITKLVWAVALGLIVLEIASEATGQYWDFRLPATGRGLFKKEPYKPLYGGQGANAAPSLAGAPKWSEHGAYAGVGVSTAPPVNTYPDTP